MPDLSDWSYINILYYNSIGSLVNLINDGKTEWGGIPSVDKILYILVNKLKNF